MEKRPEDFFGFSLKLAAFLNLLSILFPWWSKFQVIDRLRSDAFFFGFVSYHVDPPPVIIVLPSGNASLEVSFWPTTYLPFVGLWLLLICVGSYLFIKASSKANILTKYSLLGFLITLISLTIFVTSVIAFGGFGSFMGAVSFPSWQDWGPDIGFLLFFFSVALSFVSLIVQLNNRRLRKKRTK